MADQIKPGSIVQLKSGGPNMTVRWVAQEETDGVTTAYCDWFVQDRAPWKLEEKTFHVTSLKLLEP